MPFEATATLGCIASKYERVSDRECACTFTEASLLSLFYDRDMTGIAAVIARECIRVRQ